MNVIFNESVYAFDVDKTLVSARRSTADGFKDDDIVVRNPYTGHLVYLSPHKGHVDLLKEMAGRDRFIMVWSAAGVQWARVVIEALGLQEFVTGDKGLIITKPTGYVDDQPASAFMPNHIFLGPEDRT